MCQNCPNLCSLVRSRDLKWINIIAVGLETSIKMISWGI
jgi:hypothetical protein